MRFGGLGIWDLGLGKKNKITPIGTSRFSIVSASSDFNQT